MNIIEKILPLVKFIFFNFDYFLILFIVFLWVYVKYQPKSKISSVVIKTGDKIYKQFLKLIKIKPVKLLLMFFVLNLIIRLLMAIPVPDISLDKIAPHYLNLARSMYEGKGFTTHVIWNNFLQHPNIVRPDFFRLPLYPLLIAISYKIFGLSFFSAKLVNIIVGSLLPIITYLLAYLLTKSKRIATLSLIFISFNQLIFTWTVIPYPEITYSCFAILALYFLYRTKNKINHSAIFVGIFWALTYLTRAEALYIFLPIILFFYFYKQNKKQFLIKTVLTIFGFLIIALPYLARNYVLTKKPFYSDFSRIVMVAYVDYDYLIESPNVEYNNIFDTIIKNPYWVIKNVSKNLLLGVLAIPPLLIYSFAIFILSFIGIYYVYKNERLKYNYLFLFILFGFLVPTISIFFTDRYLINLLVLFYFFASIGIFKVHDYHLHEKHLLRSLLIIYLFIFIISSGLVGITKATLPYIPHSFYKRFNADLYFTDLQKLYDYVKNNTKKNDVIMASRKPYEVYYFTQRPTIIFPFTDENGVQEFMKKYQVNWIIHMGNPIIVEDKFLLFWPEDLIPENIEPVFKNTGGDLYQVKYYTE